MMNNTTYNLIIVTLLIVIALMGARIYGMKQVSMDKAIECMAKMRKDMPKEEMIECRPAMEKMGFKYNPKTDDDS